MGTPIEQALAKLAELRVSLQDFTVTEEGATTTCVICKRRGAGWEITEVRSMPNIHLAGDVMSSGTVGELKYTSLVEWRKGISTWPLTRAYLHWGVAPGDFVQVLWTGSPVAVEATKKRLERANNDFCGEYLEANLWELTKEEKKRHWDETLAM